jgi:hypothetical protein
MKREREERTADDEEYNDTNCPPPLSLQLTQKEEHFLGKKLMREKLHLKKTTRGPLSNFHSSSRRKKSAKQRSRQKTSPLQTTTSLRERER